MNISLKICFSILVASNIVSCNNTCIKKEEKNNEPIWITMSEKELAETTPRKFFHYLKSLNSGRILINGNVKNWITKKDVKYFASFLDDQTSCAEVSSTASSFVGSGESTLSQQARFLILGYKYKLYPPSPNSERCNLEGIVQIKKWLRGKLIKKNGASTDYRNP